MTIRVGINGFGRIGMLTTKALMRNGGVEVVAVNDVMPLERLSLLFERDSTHGIWHENVSFDGNVLRIGEREIKTFSEHEPSRIPWGGVGVDVVVESSGKFTSREAAAGHLEGDANRGRTRRGPHLPRAAGQGRRHGTQGSDPRRLHNGLRGAVGQRDFGRRGQRSLQAGRRGEMKEILEYSEDPLVSSDIVGDPASCIFDSQLTMSVGGTIKVLGWYDNEWGFSNRTADLVRYIGGRL